MKILLAAINARYTHTNLAIRYIKAYCSNYNINIKEYTINDRLYGVIDDIYDMKPDILGLSCYIWNIDFVLKLCSTIKKVLPSTIIVLGGPEVSYDSIEMMGKNPYIDFTIKGEGELSAQQFFDYLEGKIKDIHDVGGLVYRDNGGIKDNAENPLIQKMDTIPFPYKLEPQSLKNRILYYESSRGCPYNCSYCLSSTIKGLRFLSLDRVKTDLLWFINNNVALVKFVDRTFNCGGNYLSILEFLVQNRKNTKFHFEISGDILEDRVIDFLNSVPEGLFQFEIGVQSTNTATLENICRKSSFSQLSDNIKKLSRKGNMQLHLDLIAGLPGEGFSSFSKSFNDVFSLKPHMLQLGFLKLLKGCKLREAATDYGIVYTEYPPYEVLCTKELSFSEISALKRIEDLVDRYYNSGRFSAVLSFLMKKFQNPFIFFSRLSDFENSHAFKSKNISNVGQYKLIYDFCTEALAGDMGIIKECLAFDYLMQGRNPSVPTFLSGEEQVDKQFIWDYFSYDDNVRVNMPHYIDKGVKYIVKNIYTRRFSFDICRFIKNSEISIMKKIVVFDYGYKDISGKVNFFTIDDA